jgi:hypothetical protein
MASVETLKQNLISCCRVVLFHKTRTEETEILRAKMILNEISKLEKNEAFLSSADIRQLEVRLANIKKVLRSIQVCL